MDARPVHRCRVALAAPERRTFVEAECIPHSAHRVGRATTQDDGLVELVEVNLRFNALAHDHVGSPEDLQRPHAPHPMPPRRVHLRDRGERRQVLRLLALGALGTTSRFVRAVSSP